MTSEETLAELERQMREAEHGTHATIVYFGTLTSLLADSRELRRLRASLSRLEQEWREKADTEELWGDMTDAQEKHGPQPEDSPANYVTIFLMVSVVAGDLVTAKKLMDNRREAEQLVAGVLGMM